MVKVKNSSRPTRDAYGEEILALGRENPNIYVVDCDISKSCKTISFAKELPRQHVNVGIAEQNACGMAAGSFAQSAKTNGGGGMSAKMSPSAILVIQYENV